MRRVVFLLTSMTAVLQAWPAAAQETGFAPALPREGATLTFRNDLIDAWDVVWPAGTSTPMHRHAVDYFGVELTDSETLLTSPDGTERTVTLQRGRVWFLRAGVTHAETGLSEDPPRHAIIVELKGALPPTRVSTTELPTGPVDRGIEPAVDNERATLWDVVLPTTEPLAMRFHERPVVLLLMEDTDLEWKESGGGGGRRSFAAGQVWYLSPGVGRAIWSRGGAVRAIVAELKS